VINRQDDGTTPTRPWIRSADNAAWRELWTARGRVIERIYLFDGTIQLLPLRLPLTIREFRRCGKVTFRWYHVLDVSCRNGLHEPSIPVQSPPSTSAWSGRRVRDQAPPADRGR